MSPSPIPLELLNSLALSTPSLPLFSPPLLSSPSTFIFSALINFNRSIQNEKLNFKSPVRVRSVQFPLVSSSSDKLRTRCNQHFNNSFFSFSTSFLLSLLLLYLSPKFDSVLTNFNFLKNIDPRFRDFFRSLWERLKNVFGFLSP